MFVTSRRRHNAGPMLAPETLPPRAKAEARDRTGARRLLRAITDPRELRTLCLRGLRRALDRHMRSAFFLRCMRHNLNWMIAVKSTAAPHALRATQPTHTPELRSSTKTHRGSPGRARGAE